MEHSTIPYYDCIVVGFGSMGSSTLYQLAKRGYTVLGLDQFTIPHEQGAHTGQTRIIRKAYFEHPDYVPLLERAYEGWKEIETVSNTKLYYETGLVYFGQPDHEIIKGVLRSAGLYSIPVEIIPAGKSTKHFPWFSLPEDYIAIHEPQAGFLLPEKAISTYASAAQRLGAVLHTAEKVLDWKPGREYIIVITDKGSYRCDKLILTAGPWAGKLIPAISHLLQITRQHIAWARPREPEKFLADIFPCWLIAPNDEPGAYYGFPVLPAGIADGPAGMKLALHYPASVTDPDMVTKETDTEAINKLQGAMDQYLPAAEAVITDTKTCLYANSPDEHFIIGPLPEYEGRVLIAAGFSGHGFKFIPVAGEILADMAINGSTSLSAEFLNPARFLPG